MYNLIKYQVCRSDSKHCEEGFPEPIGYIYNGDSYSDPNSAYRKLEQLHDNLANVDQCNECLY